MELTLTSKKPLWVDETKEIYRSIAPNLNLEEIEKSKEMFFLNQSTNNAFYDSAEYPFYQNIKKLMYAFGDYNQPMHRSVLEIHEFLNKWYKKIK